MISGSADKTIRVWDENYVCVKTITTPSYIRGLSVVPEVGFLSCGSECALQLWSYDGELLYDLRGHKDTVYSATSLPSGELVSSSEDCSVIVWNGTEVSQSLATPSGVWSVAALDNGDIVAACQDRKIRVFTRDEKRFMSDDKLASYMEDVMVAAAAAAESAKPKKQVVNGVEYDHLIQVDIAEGQPTIPLGYNDDEAAVDAAERFLVQNNISPMYLDQITQFIQNAMGESKFAQNRASAAPYVDPFRDTAVPAQYGTNVASPASQAHARPAATGNAPVAKNTHPFPLIAPILIDSGKPNFPPVLAKLKNLNELLVGTTSQLSEDELKLLESLAGKITSAPQMGSQNVHFSRSEVENVQNCLKKLPVNKKFPVLDIARLAVLFPDFANQSRETLLPLVRSDLDGTADSSLTQLMALRVFLNAFKWKILHPALTQLAESVLETLAPSIACTYHASIPSLAISLLRNYSTLLCETKSDARAQILNVAHESILLADGLTPDFVYLGLYSIGSIVSRDAEMILLAQSMGVPDAVELYASSMDENVKQAAKNLATIFTSGVPK